LIRAYTFAGRGNDAQHFHGFDPLTSDISIFSCATTTVFGLGIGLGIAVHYVYGKPWPHTSQLVALFVALLW